MLSTLRISFLTIFFVVSCMSTSVHAALIDNGDGTISDTHTNLMWMQDVAIAGPLNNEEAALFALNFVFAGYDNWRLPSTVINDPGCSNQAGGNSTGGGCSLGEMGHVYYNDTAQVGFNDTPFINFFGASSYWTSTSALPSIGHFGGSHADYVFNQGGAQSLRFWGNKHQSWLVRDVSPVPIPAAAWLFGSSLVLLGWVRRKQSV